MNATMVEPNTNSRKNMTTTAIRIADQSRAPSPGGAAADKVRKYNWARPGQPGDFEWVNKFDLQIDLEYQREQVSEGKVLDIARQWDWRLVQCLSVARRADGTLTLFDGGHRYRAAMKRSDVQVLPCMIHDVADVADEARAFVGTNTLSSAVSSYEKHRAGKVAQEPVAIRAAEILEANGYAVARTTGSPFTTKAIGCLEKMVRADAKLAESVVRLATEVAGGDQLAAATLRGIYGAAKIAPEILSGVYAKKLVAAGQEVLLAEISRRRLLVGKGGEKVETQAVIQFVNKGRRSRALTVES